VLQPTPHNKTSTGLYVVAALEVLAVVLILLFMPRRPTSTIGTDA
jgi:hypothetical protein